MKKFLTLALALFSATSLTTASFAGKGDYVTQTPPEAVPPLPTTPEEASEPSENDDNTDSTTAAPTTYTGSQTAQIAAGVGLGSAALGAGFTHLLSKKLNSNDRRIVGEEKAARILNLIPKDEKNSKLAELRDKFIAYGHSRNPEELYANRAAIYKIEGIDSSHSNLVNSLHEEIEKPVADRTIREKFMPGHAITERVK